MAVSTKMLLFVTLGRATFRVPASLFVVASERWDATPGECGCLVILDGLDVAAASNASAAAGQP